MERGPMRYALQLEMLERHDALCDHDAIDLLHSELMLAMNAGCLIALSTGDLDLRVIERSSPQEGVTRFAVDLVLEERSQTLDDDAAGALVQRAFTDALNASYLLRICTDDLVTVRLVARVAVGSPAVLRAA